MDASSVFATGGASGVVGIVGFLFYRFFFSKHRITSRCCGREMSVEVDGSTPRVNNVAPTVEDATIIPSERRPSNARRLSRGREGQGPPLEGEDRSRVSGDPSAPREPNKEVGKEDVAPRVLEGPSEAPRSD